MTSTPPVSFTSALLGDICIVGNLNIDLIIRNVPRLPRWGQEIFGSSLLQVSSGQAGYNAFSLRGLGTPTRVIGNVGEDLYGQQILEDLRRAGLDTSGCEVTPGGQTGITVAIVHPSGERAFVSNFGCLRDFDESLVERHWDQVEPASIFCLVGLFALPGLSIAAAARLMLHARQAGKITVLDTGWDPANWSKSTRREMETLLAATDIFLPNWDEAQALTRTRNAAQAAQIIQSHGPQLVVIKQGEDGSYARFRESSWSQPVIPVQVYDAVGAGDNFNAGFLTGLRRGWPIPDCLAFGAATAALYISRPVDRFPSEAEVLHSARTMGWL